MRHARLMSALSIPLGFVVGHVVAYSIAASDNVLFERTVHGYFGSIAGSAVALGLFAILVAVVQGHRRQDLGLRASTLIAQLVTVYVAIEVLEHLSAGVSPAEILTERTLLIGAVVQVGIGLGLHRLLRAGHRLGESLADPEVAIAGDTPALPMPASQTVPSWSRRASIRLRGPPRLAL